LLKNGIQIEGYHEEKMYQAYAEEYKLEQKAKSLRIYNAINVASEKLSIDEAIQKRIKLHEKRKEIELQTA